MSADQIMRDYRRAQEAEQQREAIIAAVRGLLRPTYHWIGDLAREADIQKTGMRTTTSLDLLDFVTARDDCRAMVRDGMLRFAHILDANGHLVMTVTPENAGVEGPPR